jgi:ubiquitin carboxyl-terminal hydrolase 9/13
MGTDNAATYGMDESLFTSLKDIFEAVIAHKSNVGVVSPTKFLEVLKRENETFRTAMHQDAHEFLNLLLNEVVLNVEVHSKRLEEEKLKGMKGMNGMNGSADKTGFEQALASAMPKANKTGWVHELFEGTLTSETKCLTCENVSQRDEAFLDLSVDLDEHSSVTACLRKFSEEEMLCERNKFHCDRCGGLQEAEKRMKIKRLPKILALHLKRFKYTEDLQRLQKLFHRVVYPYHLRLFNTTDDAEDPDRLYELYAVVVHIGGGPYHGHYVSIVKTGDRGWLLFDDENVEPVDKSYVQNFFGDRPGLACAYVLFYQETTLEAVKREQDAESLAAASQAAAQVPKEPIGLGLKTNGFMNGIHHMKSAVSPAADDTNGPEGLDHAVAAPSPALPAKKSPTEVNGLIHVPSSNPFNEDPKSKKERAKQEKDRKSIERIAARQEEKAERERRKNIEVKRKELSKQTEANTKAAIEASKTSKADEDHRFAAENGHREPVAAVLPSGGLSRFKSSGKSFRRPKMFTKEVTREEPIPDGDENTVPSVADTSDKSADKSKHRFSSLRKKSSNMKLL